MRLPGKAVKNIFDPPSFSIPSLPPIPDAGDDDVQRARRAEEAARRRRGRRQTQLTGGLGVQEDAPVVRPTLGG